MVLTPYTIQATSGAKKQSKRVGRGNASQKGTTAGRGTKGQKARSGGTRGVARLGLKPSIQKVPKKRGFRSHRAKPVTMTLAMIHRVATDGDVVTPWYLAERGLLAHRDEQVKVVATGLLEKKITLQGCLASKGAVAAIEKAGGKVTF